MSSGEFIIPILYIPKPTICPVKESTKKPKKRKRKKGHCSRNSKTVKQIITKENRREPPEFFDGVEGVDRTNRASPSGLLVSDRRRVVEPERP